MVSNFVWALKSKKYRIINNTGLTVTLKTIPVVP